MTGVAVEVGSTANNYQILARLASGGMAEIFLARGTSTTGVERYCVLKRILRERANDVQFVRMFLDEARLAAQLQHPNIAQVYDIGKLGDSYFFTMEYVHGETVRAVLHRARSLRREVPLGSVLTVISGAAAGLHHAHERLGHDGKPLGIVHRDVSPSNLMVSYEGSVKVVDFGVAKAENRAQETRSGAVKGKIAYLSPEQCRGTAIDRRSDLFSLGIVFWEMLAMERLYKRASDFDNMSAIVTEEAPPPSSRRGGIPPELDRISLKLLAKDPAQRYQTADELVEAIEEVAPKLGLLISPSALGRFLREMFGQRPEPWLELDATTHEVSVANVTVTSEPIPAELVADKASSVDAQLAAVPQLMPPMSASGPSASGAVPAIQTPAASAAVTSPAIPPAMPTERLPLPPPPATQVAVAALRPAAPGFGQTSDSFPSQQSASYPSASGLLPRPAIERDEPPPAAQRGPLIAIIAGAAILGSLGVWLAMRGGDGDAPVADAALAVAPASDAAAPTAEPPPAPADAAVEVAEPAAAPDAAAPAVAADAAEVAEPEIDPYTAAMAESRYRDAVVLCTRGVGEHGALCTLAACQERDARRARQWSAKLGAAERTAVVAKCRDLGIDLAPKPVRPRTTPDAGVDPCIANPMACQ